VIGIAVAGERAAVQVFPLRGGKMVDRHSFHLETRGRQSLDDLLEAFVLEYTAPRRAVPPQIVVPVGVGDTSHWRVPDGAARLTRRGARAERGEKRRLQQLAARTRASRSRRTRVAEQKRLRRVEALEELREALNLESLPIRIECFDISNIQGEACRLDGRLPGRGREEGALPQVRRARLDGQDDFAAMAEVVSRRFARLATRDRSTTTTRRSRRAEPRRRSTAARASCRPRCGDAGVRPAARGRDRAREAVEEVFVPGEPTPIVLDRTRPGCSSSSGSATRRTGSRSASTAAARREGARVDLRHAPGVGPARRARPAAHFGSAERLARGDAGGARGRPGTAREDGARDLRASCTGRARLPRSRRGASSPRFRGASFRPSACAGSTPAR
jgi:excinuclease ABC subunit C